MLFHFCACVIRPAVTVFIRSDFTSRSLRDFEERDFEPDVFLNEKGLHSAFTWIFLSDVKLLVKENNLTWLAMILLAHSVFCAVQS